MSSSSNNNINLSDKNDYEENSEHFINNNNLEKSKLSNSINKKIVMPPKLNLNINLNVANKINSLGSVEDTSGSKDSCNNANSNKDINLELPKKGNKNENNDIDNDNDDLLEEDEDDKDLIPDNIALINNNRTKT